MALEIINQYSTLVTTVATVVIGLATVYYAWQNKKIAEGLKVQTKPNIRFLMSKNMNVTLENIGKLTAREVRVRFAIKIVREKEIGSYFIEELNPGEKEYIDLGDRIFVFLEMMKLITKEERVVEQSYFDPDTGEDLFFEEKFERWSVTKSETIKIRIKASLSYKSYIGNLYQSIKEFAVNIIPLSLTYQEDAQFMNKLTTTVSSRQGSWIALTSDESRFLSPSL